MALATYAAIFGAGLLQIAERNWYFGSIYTVVGGLGFLNLVYPVTRVKLQPLALWAMVTITWLFLAANIGFAVHDHFWPKPSALPEQSAPSPDTWPSLTNAQASALAARVHFIPQEEIVVACETLKCRDLADGIAEILRTTPGWKVSIIHGGGIGISGVTGIRLNPREPATEARRDAIESTTPLQVTMGPDSRQQLGTQPSLLVVGSKPF